MDSNVVLDKIASKIGKNKKVTIDCGVMAMGGVRLNELMKIAASHGVKDFRLINVCGQSLIGTGVRGIDKISVYGLMGNHCAAFIDQVTLNTYPTEFPNGVWCPGDAQVAIGNTANPKELNVSGSVDDLFASYAPSGLFQVAGQGGNRCGLRGGAGVPRIWRKIDYGAIEGMSTEEIKESLLYKYQLRRAQVEQMQWKDFVKGFRIKVEDRNPPVIVFGRKVRDYFMEYAQGTIGVILNVYDIDDPVGYYLCSGMTAGKAYVRGPVHKSQLGVRATIVAMSDEDNEFLKTRIEKFFNTFNGRLADTYQDRLNKLVERYHKDPYEVLDTFVKIVPEN